ncbi:glutamine-rich protein 2 isoform X3 [Larimichthys crocea]|uniref:glutamine-rich protein 2 isoform X3 n=1 Tax=Larimichthys crocea TaxID=215358 RepID=UPI000F5F31F5|nr:glutamine-rich protein 2 isoform X3 [Larimichthys crocea]
MSEDISLYELLNLSIGTPHRGAVNFGALHALLYAVLRHLDLRDVKTRWRGDTAAGSPEALLGDIQRDTAGQAGQQPGDEPQEHGASSADGQARLRTRIQTCEDDVSKAMKLIEELQHQKDSLKEEVEELRHQQQEVEELRHQQQEVQELRHQQQVFDAHAETVTAVEKCCHRVDAVEEAVRSLKDSFQKYPRPEVLSHYVTRDAVQSAQLSEDENLHKPLKDSSRPAAPSSASISGQISSLQEVTDTEPATEAPPAPSGSLQQIRGHPETTEALRNIDTLKERFNELEGRVAALEEELVTNKGSQDVLDHLDELSQQRDLMDGLMSDQEKMFLSQDTESSSEAEAADTDSKAFHELRQQMSSVRKSVQKLDEDVKKLKVKQALTDARMRDRHLQDQLDELQGMLEEMMLSLTSQLFGCLQDEAGQDESGSQGVSGQSKARSAFTTCTANIGRKLNRVFKHYEQLQDTVNSLLQQQARGRAGELKDAENVELVNDVQKAILQLQAECEKLNENTKCLHEDNRRKQTHIEELYKTTEELEEKKADKQMVESEIKADKSALDSKVSRLQFDSVTEQLNAMFHELLSKVTGQEQDWHKVIDKLSTEMECKLNRMELDSVKKQLEGRWKNIHEKLQAQGAPEHDDAAGLRKQLVDRFHCLSCDRPVVKYTPGPHLVKLPSSPAFPAHKSIRPFTVYALEQFRQHCRSWKPGTNRSNFEVAHCGRRGEQLQESHNVTCKQIECVQRRYYDRARDNTSNRTEVIQNQPGILHERVSELTDYSHLSVSRSCGGSHTVTSVSQRRSGLQSGKHHAQTEADSLTQSEEVDIVGLDGHIYKGRLNASATRSTETKLPTISTKDGMCKPKDKAKNSMSHKPSVSPEAPLHHAHSAKSSRSASSLSGRDWPVSTLGCTSHSSFTQASAAAESNMEALPSEPVHL